MDAETTALLLPGGKEDERLKGVYKKEMSWYHPGNNSY